VQENLDPVPGETYLPERIVDITPIFRVPLVVWNNREGRDRCGRARERTVHVVIDGPRTNRFDSIEIEATGPLTASVRATGNTAFNRGNQEPIQFAARLGGHQVSINPATPFRWTFTARPLAK